MTVLSWDTQSWNSVTMLWESLSIPWSGPNGEEPRWLYKPWLTFQLKASINLVAIRVSHFALKISIKPIWYSLSFNAAVSLLIFFLEDLSSDVNGVLKTPTMTVFLLVPPSMYIKICFIHLGAPLLGAKCLQGLYPLVGLLSLSLYNVFLCLLL